MRYEVKTAIEKRKNRQLAKVADIRKYSSAHCKKNHEL